MSVAESQTRSGQVLVEGGREPQAGLWHQFSILLRMQLARVRLAWARYLIVSSVMPLGITILLRVPGEPARSRALQFVAGDMVLATALCALTYLGQRVAWMRANRVFDYYNTLPVSPALLLTATFLSYFLFAVPGMVLIGIVGGLLYGLPLSPSLALLLAVPTVLFGGVALAGVGTLIGLAGRDEQLTSTYCNLAMMTVLFLGIVPSSDFPGAVRDVTFLLPSTYMIDSLKMALVGTVHMGPLLGDLAACVAFAVVLLGWSTRVLRTRSD